MGWYVGTHMGSPDHPHCLRMVRTPLAHVGPSRRLHRGYHPGPSRAMWFKWTSGTWAHVGRPRVIPRGLRWYMGPMWAGPDLSHVGFWYMEPMWAGPDLSNLGF